MAERLIGEGVVVLALLAWWALARNLPEFILPGPVAVGASTGRVVRAAGFPVARVHLGLARAGLDRVRLS